MRRDYSTGEMLFRLICLVVMSSVESFDWTAQPTNPTLAIKEQDVSLAWQYSLTADELVQSQTQFLIFWKKLNQSTSKYDLIGTKNFLQVIGVIGYVEPQTPRIVIDRSDQATLHIKDVRSEDEGTYKIEFTLKTDGSILAEQRVNLTVFVPVVLTKVSDNQTVLEGSNTTLFCEATGQPEPGITLTRLLEDGSDGEVLPQQPTWNFQSISRNYSGTYRCTAKNAFQDVSQVFKVNVTYPAKIVKLVSEHNVTSQQSVSLVCQAEGNPQPTYSWTPCDSGQNVCHKSELNFKASDKSVYTLTCKVENYLGNDTGNTTLFIASDVINVTMVITGEDCTDGEKLRKTIEEIFASELGYESVELKSIRPGSVDLALKFTSTVRESEVLSILEDAVKNGKFGVCNVTAITGTRGTRLTPTMVTTPASSPDSTTWIIVGVVVGVVAVLAVAGGVAWYVYKKRKCKKRDSKVHNNGSQGEAGGNVQDEGYVQVNKGYEERANRRSGGGNTSPVPPALYDTAQTGNRGAVRGAPAPQYAAVDKSKKKPRKPQPGELQYAELAEFSTGQGGQRSSLSPTNRQTETQYADVNAM